MGSFSFVYSDMQVGQVCQLRVSEKLNMRLFLTCCRISPEELLLADRANRTIYRLNNKYQLISSLDLDETPFDIYQIGDKKCAVLLYDGTGMLLAFIDIEDDMKVKVKSKMRHNCCGMVCYSDKLYMIDSSRVYIYDLEGTFQCVLYTNESPNSDFRHISISEENQLIYLTCITGGLITIDISGKFVGKYTEPVIANTWGVSLDFAGNVLVCGSTSPNVLKISSDGTTRIDMLENEEEDKEGKVTVLFFDKQTGLLLSTGSAGNINVTKLQ